MRLMNHRWHAMNKKIILIILALLLSAAVLSALLSRFALTVSRYELLEPGLTEHVRIVQLSDLHNSEFGTDNARLAEKVAKQEPDLILIPGDLLNENEERTDIAVTLIGKLAEIAPVYVSYGNHELGHQQHFDKDIRKLYSQAGAVVLDENWVDVSVNDQELRIGGIYGYCLPPVYVKTGEARLRECAFLEAFQDTDRTTVLLCHMPVGWILYGGLDGWDVDVVLTGHIHGGQVRLPWIGGLWAPDQGWFPGKSCGLYFSEDGERAMVLTRGLGNTDKIPRLNNIPEILVLDLVPEQTA